MKKVEISVLKKFFEDMGYTFDFIVANKSTEILLGKKYDVVVSDWEGYELRFNIYVDEKSFRILSIYEEGVELINSASDESAAWVKALTTTSVAETVGL
ncbi:MAG: hypothetical protein MJ149_02415 [Clostridia bacterium]|nr:hypothetical protein [Clostridia bacterium]